MRRFPLRMFPRLRVWGPRLCLVAAVAVIGLAASPAPLSGSDSGNPAHAVHSEQDIGALFERVVPKLGRTIDLVDRHDELPDHTYFFGEDKASNLNQINRLLDQAIDALAVSGLRDARLRIRRLEDKVDAAHRAIATHQRKKVSAPTDEELNLLDQANPFVVTRSGYDQRIEAERKKIERYKAALDRIKTAFTKRLEDFGLEIDRPTVDGLLSSVTGDDLLDMAVVFRNVKRLTVQLEKLTNQSGEALDAAKRYYGMYVVLVKVLDHTQTRFMDEIRDEHIPQLEMFAQQARANIAQARRLIETGNGHEKTLRKNIESNQTTYETARLYVDYLSRQADMVAEENEAVQRNLATAMNTYQTVKLSSNVAALIQSGREDFEELMSLRLPYLREFQNKVIRKEFERMTEQLRSDT